MIGNELQKLNEHQYEAVVYTNGPLFVVAGAGTGKTKTLTTRIAYLITKLHIDPNQILGVTFTNKAAREIRERVNMMIAPKQMGAWLYTFHAFGLRVLRENAINLELGYSNNFNVIDEDDVSSILKDIIKDMNIDIKEYPARMVKNAISNHKTEIQKIDDEMIKDIFKKYTERMIQDDLMDFDDLIVYTRNLLKNNTIIKNKYQNKFKHILIDEFQDTDKIQYEIIKLLNNQNIFVVGDPDQSIYAFRGARYENNQLFINEFNAKVIVLDKNYRSTNNILEAANLLIAKNKSRTTAKNLISDFEKGEPVTKYFANDDYDEVRVITNEIKSLVFNKYQYSDIAILYRNNNLSRMFEHSFMQNQIPYIIYGGTSFYERKEVKDIIAYLKLIVDDTNNFYFQRVVNVPARGIGPTTVKKLFDYASQVSLPMIEAIDSFNIASKTHAALNQFKDLISSLRKKALEIEDCANIIDIIFQETGYKELLKEENDEKAKDRKQNIFELKSIFKQFNYQNIENNNIEIIKTVLDEIALYTDINKENKSENSVKLATIHQVKGLEFKVVFVVALEEGIFPRDIAYSSAFELEEERRTFYVAITRAKEKLYLTYANKRMLYGKVVNSGPSIFVNETKLKEVKQQYQYKTPIKNNIKQNNNEVFNISDIVTHEVFGSGVIVAINDEVLTIAFGVNYGIKKILATHPSIKKVKH